MTNTIFTGLTPAYGDAVGDGAWVGTMTFSVESNLSAPAASNVSAVTGHGDRLVEPKPYLSDHRYPGK